MTDLTCYTTAHLDCFVMALERDGEREGGRERAREREREREAGRTNWGEQRKAMCCSWALGHTPRSSQGDLHNIYCFRSTDEDD